MVTECTRNAVNFNWPVGCLIWKQRLVFNARLRAGLVITVSRSYKGVTEVIGRLLRLRLIEHVAPEWSLRNAKFGRRRTEFVDRLTVYWSLCEC